MISKLFTIMAVISLCISINALELTSKAQAEGTKQDKRKIEQLKTDLMDTRVHNIRLSSKVSNLKDDIEEL